LSFQAIPQVVVFGGREAAPSTCHSVYICANAKIRTVDMRMRAVGMNEIRFAEAHGDMWRMLVKGVYVDGAGNCLNALLGESNLVDEPAKWELAVRIGVGEPTPM
jgi:hypothetical protein